MRKISSLLFYSVFGLAGLTSTGLVTARAQTLNDDTFAHEGTDWAHLWLDTLLHGAPSTMESTPQVPQLASIINGLHQALSIYSLSILVLAGLLLLYHVVSMVAETAHSGVAFGRRTNAVWTPIRFVFALGLLIPITGGLSSGQYLVLKIAEEGSALASKAWETMADNMGGTISTLVTPHEPNFAHLVATATEMEICRDVYLTLYTPLANDPAIGLAGPLTMSKLPADRFSEEIWRYSNYLNASSPLCGEYRFSGYRRHSLISNVDMTDMDHAVSSISDFARTDTDSLIIEARAVANRVMPLSLNSPTALSAVDIHSDLATIETTHRTNFQARLRTLTAFGTQGADQMLAQSTQSGWIAAAFFVPELVRTQESYGELITYALPDVQEPLLAHRMVLEKLFSETAHDKFWVQPLDATSTQKLAGFYDRLADMMSYTHGWIYNTQLSDHDFVAANSFDLRDRLTTATDPKAMSALFAQALDTAAVAQGVWGVSGSDAGYPFAITSLNIAMNPITMLAEFGRRQYELGSSLSDLSNQTLGETNAIIPSLLIGLVGFCFMAGSLILIFAVPFLPFFRFLLVILAWVIDVFEAVVAMPIVALAHMTPSGDGLSGGTARQSYVLWLNLLIRPVLALFGLIFGLVVFAFATAFVGTALLPLAQLSSVTNGGLSLLTNIGLVLIFDILIYAAANASFKGINLFPEQALRWVTSFVVTEGGGDMQPVNASGGNIGANGSASSMGVGTGFTNVLGQSASAANEPKNISASGGKAETATKSHGLKTALFPVYGASHEKTASDEQNISSSASNESRADRANANKIDSETGKSDRAKPPLDQTAHNPSLKDRE